VPLWATVSSTAIVPVPPQFGETMAHVDGLGGPPAVAASKSSQSGSALQFMGIPPVPALVLPLLEPVVAAPVVPDPDVVEAALPPAPVVEADVALSPPEPDAVLAEVELEPSPEHPARTEQASASGPTRRSPPRPGNFERVFMAMRLRRNVGAAKPFVK